ncbi:MAG: hypothetical protein LBI58_00830, partial [Tannerellaceae bacterium]|nr:hypothetical protein [Tannerellaceae bacterium]
MSDYSRFLAIAAFASLMFSCSSVRFVDQGDYLLDKVDIVSDISSHNKAELKPYVRQLPNFKAFGLVKWQLYVYGWSGKKSPDRWISKQLRKMGEAPVILDTILVRQSVAELDRFLTNKGYTGAVVSASIDSGRNRKAVVTYHITGNKPYIIRNYTMEFADRELDSIAHLKAPQRSWIESAFRTATDDYSPAISEGSLFDRDLLDKERQRITSLMRRNGFYAFNRDNLGYIADSSFLDNAVDLRMILYPQRRVTPEGKTEESAHRPYFIKEVNVLTDYDPLRLDGRDAFTPTDTVRQGPATIIYG